MFWEDAEYLFDVYAEAYNNKTNREAWLNGLYSYKAMESAINNMTPYAIAVTMNEKLKFKPLEYPSEPINFYGYEVREVDEISVEETAYALENKMFNF